MQPTTVLFIDHTACLGGGEISLFNLVTHLDATRYRPIVLLFESGALADRLRGHGIETHILPLDRRVMDARKDGLGFVSALRLQAALAGVRHTWHVSRFIRELRPSLVHTNSLKSDIIGGLAARLSRTTLVWHVRDRIADDYLPRPVASAFRWVARWLPTHVVANSASTLETLKPGLNAGERYSVIHNGTVVGPPRSASVEERTERPVVGLIGRISPWKGQDVLIRAAALLKERGVDCEVRLIGVALFGEEAFEQSLRDLVSALAVDDRVVFSGFRSKIPEEIAQLDLLVHASTTPEPFGQVIIEGMAAGKPVIASGAGGVLEIVEDGVTGVLVAPGDPDALANAIEAILRDPSHAAALGANGCEVVLQRFTIQHVARRVERLYDRVLFGTGPRRKVAPLATALAMLIALTI